MIHNNLSWLALRTVCVWNLASTTQVLCNNNFINDFQQNRLYNALTQTHVLEIERKEGRESSREKEGTEEGRVVDKEEDKRRKEKE